MQKAAVAVLLSFAVYASLDSAGVWDTKPFAEWTDKDVEKIMQDSPWAGKGSLTHAREGANLGTVPDWELIVAVRSALPFRQALVRRQIGLKGTTTAEHEALLTAEEQTYTLSLGGLPRSLGPALQKVADAAEIRRRGKEPIKATQGGLMWFDRKGLQVALDVPARPQILFAAQQRGGGFGGGGFGQQDNSGVTGTLVLGFPKTNPITAADNEFDFVTTIGSYHVKRTFKLKDMVFKGQLSL
jgi:hypothetical protein